MTITQAKTKVAQHLAKLGVDINLIHLSIEMTKPQYIAAVAVCLEDTDLTLEEMKEDIYMPEHLFI